MSTDYVDADDVAREVAEMFGDILEQSQNRSGVGFDDILLQSIIKLAISVITLRKAVQAMGTLTAESIADKFGSTEAGHNVILLKLQENNINNVNSG